MSVVWRFRTANYEVRCTFEPEDIDPEDCFCNQADVDAVRNGDVTWFCAVVEVLKNEHVLGSDSLGGCAYNTVEDFIAAHRDPNPMNRNCSMFRAVHPNTRIGHYFPDMVRSAIADARSTAQD